MTRTPVSRPWLLSMTIGRSFLLWLLGVLLVVLVLVSALVLWHERTLLERELVERAEMLARALLVAATDERSPAFPGALSLADLRSGEVRGAHGEILWSYGLPPEQALELDPELLRVEVVATAEEASAVLSPPRVVLLLSRTRIAAAIATAAVRLVLALAAVLPIALLVGLLVIERIVRPLRRLGNFLDRLDTAVEPQAPELGAAATEVAELARTTFDMAARLHEQRAQLMASERRFRELFLDSPTPLLHLDESLLVLAANPAAARLLGVESDKAAGTGLDCWLGDRGALEALARLVGGAGDAAQVVEAAWPLSREVDADIDVELHVRLLGDGTALVAVHDLTERMRRMVDRWRRTFDAMADGVALLGADGSIAAANRAMTALDPWLGGLLTEEVVRPESGSWRARSGQRVFQCSISPTADTGERILVVRDVSEAVAAEERLREAEKLEAIGALASGVAHDFNNLLAGIQLQARLLRRDPDAGDEPVAAILALAEEGSEVVREVLVYAHREHAPPQVLDLVELIRGQEAVLRHLTPPPVALTIEHGGEPMLILGNPVGLRRMILNLVLNARAAVGAGGSVRVVLGVESGSAVLEVVDDGAGIAASVLSRVFEPFYSTRRSGRGAGLGLAVVQRVASDHGGRVGIESTPGVGTRVRVQLPLATTDEITAAESPDEKGRPVSGPRVLVVTADLDRAAELMACLASHGCDPRHARDRVEAAESMVEDGPQLVVVEGDAVDSAADWIPPGLPVVVLTEDDRAAEAGGPWRRVPSAAGPEWVVGVVLEVVLQVGPST